MPTYVYRCNCCETDFEVRQSMKDDPLTSCGDCGDEVFRVIQSPTFFAKRVKRTDPPNRRVKLKGNQGRGPLIRRKMAPGYKSALARFPGDPMAVVGTEGEAHRRARELGKHITFDKADAMPPED